MSPQRAEAGTGKARDRAPRKYNRPQLCKTIKYLQRHGNEHRQDNHHQRQQQSRHFCSRTAGAGLTSKERSMPAKSLYTLFDPLMVGT